MNGVIVHSNIIQIQISVIVKTIIKIALIQIMIEIAKQHKRLHIIAIIA